MPGDSPSPDPSGQDQAFELMGFVVSTKAREIVGTVKDVWPIGESVLLVVESSRDSREILIPFSRAICPEVDTAGRRIVIDPPDGLLDLNEI